jgi:class 3 adenylate cyclase/tetratricopeptide (TPR) repeat protein
MPGPATSVAPGAEPLAALQPYLPRFVVEWLEKTPDEVACTVDGTGIFADISGFTQLTERLAGRGKVGAEEMGDTLNLVFGELLTVAYEWGAGLVKWGGDAVLLLVQGDDHPARGAAAAAEMQQVIRRVGQITTSSGEVRLRMSIGLHSGPIDLFLVGEEFRELIVTGPGASLVARMEAAAEAGQVVVSPASAALLGAAGARLGATVGPGRLMVAPPPAERRPSVGPLPSTLDLSQALPAPLAAHLLGGDVAYEHRSVAVCFVEFSGVDALRESSGLTATTLAVERVVSACQRAATRHDVTFLASDIYPDGGKVILVAGAPRSAGDDITRLLGAARQVMDSEQTLSMRAGMNAGRVFAGDYGLPTRRVYSLTGDCVNLAARLMAKAGTGELVASHGVLERSRTPYETEELEPFAVKGKSGLVQASLVGPALTGRVTPVEGARDLPLVGRDRELEVLLDAYDRAAFGNGRVVHLSGHPGIGKSRLLRELLARSGNATVVRLRGDIYATGTPYHPFHDFFAGPAGDRAAELRRLVEDQAPELAALLPLLSTISGADEVGGSPEVDGLDASARKSVLEASVSGLFARLFPRPTVWVFDDVQFMDGTSTDLLDRLTEDAHDRPWLIVTTRRPDADWRPPDLEHAVDLPLLPLTAAAADDLVAAAAAGTGLPAHRMADLVQRAGGNPLFLTEMAAGLGALTDDADLPDTVEAMLSARIDRLPPADRSLLRTAAVLGMVPHPDLLAAVVQEVDSRGVTAGQLTGLGEFLAPQVDGSLRFTHHLVRETAYEGLPFRRRVRLHAAAADVITDHPFTGTNRTNLLSLHSLLGERYADAYALSIEAGRHAASQFANAEAAECYERALLAARHLPGLGPREPGLVGESLAEVLADLGDLDAMADALDLARRRLRGDPLVLARLAALTAVHRRLTGRHTEALRWVTRGRRLLEGAAGPEALRLRADLAERYAQSLLAKGRFTKAIEWADTAIREAKVAADARTQARAMEIQTLARSYSGKPIDLEQSALAIELYANDHDLLGVARGHNVLGVVAHQQGSWARALMHYEEAAIAYERIGRPQDVGLQHANKAEILIFQGRLAEADQALAESLRLWRGARMSGEQAFTITQQARLAMARGDQVAAWELFNTARQVHVDNGEGYDVVVIDAMRAESLLLSGKPAGALAMIEDVQARNRDVGAPLTYVDRVKGLAQVGSGDRTTGVATIHASMLTARKEASLYDEWRCAEALVELEVVTLGLINDVAALRSAVTTQLGVMVGQEAGPLPRTSATDSIA